jgi:hypothetical protein
LGRARARPRAEPLSLVLDRAGFERTADGIRLSDAHATIDETPVEQAGDTAAPWYCEGNVQASVARFLVAGTIESAADTASRERGIDLVAWKGGRRLAVPSTSGPRSSSYERASRASLRRFA